ncbi:MAG: DNA repair protein RadA [Simkaniaceae bacterium]|nr:DNA repair protein RadA [Simkaniaceae bacterium]
MSKQKVEWVCKECGTRQKKWTGSCAACNNWDTFVEELKLDPNVGRFEAKRSVEAARPVRLNEVKTEEYARVETGFNEFDRILGGGVAAGSLSLVGGDPGIGKSTLMLQLARSFTDKGKRVLYVCGEESAAQTSMRAQRLGVTSPDIFLLNETIFSNIRQQIEQIEPDILILDSIQIVYKNELASLPGSVTQVKEIAMECMHIAKGMGITTFIIGHVTKSGELAGPRVLEHIVDTVLEFDGNQQHGYRMLRAKKNRFGPTDEVTLFQMGEMGLSEVQNPSEIFLEERSKNLPGSVIIPTIEGSRAIMVEVQALVAQCAFSSASRRSTGLDSNRLALLLAVLEKKMDYHFHSLDVFVSVAGGIKIVEPAIDLGITMAIASSFCNHALPPELALVGEVGLGGEVRRVSRIEARIKEAIHMGFTKMIIPKRNLKGLSKSLTNSIEILGVELVEEAIKSVMR